MKKRYYKKSMATPTCERQHSLVRIISKLGYCSRKEAIKIVQAGRVSINGQQVTDPAFPGSIRDRIAIDGEIIRYHKKVYIVLNKPAGYVTTRLDERGRETVYSCLKDIKEWIFPVGRLDKDSEGLLLFTNDSRFSEYMANPYNAITRTYHVLIQGNLSPQEIQFALKGVDISKGETSQPLSLDYLGQADKNNWFKIVLIEGKNREIRRLFTALGKVVLRLIHVQHGPYTLSDLRPGEWRYIEIEKEWLAKRSLYPKPGTWDSAWG
jgi:23S rRNA pseudouridine2605 synthase